MIVHLYIESLLSLILHPKCTDGPETGDVRLMYGHRGRVELFHSGNWEPVTNSSMSWTLKNSKVVCGELGYEGQQT